MSIALPSVAPRRVLADLVPGDVVRDVLLVAGGAGLVGLCAQLSIPLPGTPVPLTLSTFAVLLTGATLGARRSLAAMALYVAAGSVGVPWFSDHHAGFGGPTYGYLLAYVVVAPMVGALARRGGDRTPVRTVLTMALGTTAIYLGGVPWLMGSADLGFGAAVAAGLTPFLVGDAIKVLAAAGLLPTAWSLVRRHHS